MRTPANAFLDPKIKEFLRVTTTSKGTSVYIEIYRRLRRLIESGVLQPGDPLPGEMQLASIMCVGRTSLRTALSILYEDGYIETARGRGSVVSGDNRKEKYRRTFPTDILLPPDRIALLGELTVQGRMCDPIKDDEFLMEKLAPAPGSEIIQLQELYCLNGKPAILSFYYFNRELFSLDDTVPIEQVYDRLAVELTARTVTAEYECLPVHNSMSGLHQFMPRGKQTLVVTHYVGNDKLIAFCKDYYNSEVIRFRFAMRK